MTGYWWLPDHPDDRCYGHLERLDTRWQLVLGGRLTRAGAGRQVVHGTTVDDRPFTVLEAQWQSDHPDRMIWDAAACLDGVHLSSVDDPIGSIYVRIPEAAQLFDHKPNMSCVDSTMAVTSTRRVSGPVKLPDGTSLEIIFGSRVHRDDAARTATVGCEVVFKLTPSCMMSIPQALDQCVYPIRDFTAFGTQARVTVAQTQFALPDGESLPFTLKSSRDERPEAIESTKPWNRLLQFDARDDVASAVAKWFTLYPNYRMAVTLLLAPLFANEMYGELRLSTAIMAMESYQSRKFGRKVPKAERDPHYKEVLARLDDSPELLEFAKRRLGGGEKGLARRLKEVVEHAGEIGTLVQQALPGFQQRLIAARGRNVAHAGDWSPGYGLELHLLNRGLRWIVTTCVLRELGYGEKDADDTVRHCSRFSSDLASFRHFGPTGTVKLPSPEL